jgi:predicted phage terminase large subunit-like protein
VFPESRPTDEAAAVSRIGMTLGGAFYAVGLGGAVTGRRADVLIIDDPFKDMDEVRSPANRKAVQRWYVETALPRLKPEGAVVLIQSRFGEDDLIGYVKREHAADEWREVIFPAIAEKDEGWRKPGESLWPQMYTAKMLGRIKARNPAAWRTLYQQDPQGAEGVTIKREWWRYYKELPSDLDRNRIVLSADTAFSTKQSADFSAVTVWAPSPTGFYLLYAWRDRVGFPDLKRRLVSIAGEWGPSVVLIENKASGQSLLQELQHGTSLPIRAVDVSIDKMSRVAAVTPTIEAGRVHLPDPNAAPWVNDIIDELSAFPMAAHDDWTDSTSMALTYLRGGSGFAFDMVEARDLILADAAPARPTTTSTIVQADGTRVTRGPGGESRLKTWSADDAPLLPEFAHLRGK